MDEARFVKLMMLTTSIYDGEALTALRKANAMLAGENVNWKEMFERKLKPGAAKPKPEPPPRKPPPSAGTIDDPAWIDHMFDVLFEKVRPPSGFRVFVEDVHEWWEERGFLTQAQYDAIKKSYDRCRR